MRSAPKFLLLLFSAIAILLSIGCGGKSDDKEASDAYRKLPFEMQGQIDKFANAVLAGGQGIANNPAACLGVLAQHHNIIQEDMVMRQMWGGQFRRPQHELDRIVIQRLFQLAGPRVLGIPPMQRAAVCGCAFHLAAAPPPQLAFLAVPLYQNLNDVGRFCGSAPPLRAGGGFCNPSLGHRCPTSWGSANRPGGSRYLGPSELYNLHTPGRGRLPLQY